jgi:hypothetical protein
MSILVTRTRPAGAIDVANFLHSILSGPERTAY